ncbi:hypothetical protein RclHR1_15560001 [Rhizophagus clarus]|nr:hypothetical protein RclHR1_15560001 [Rhizophagus clarus]
MQTDKYAAFPNRESVFEVEEFYCCIEYFMVHNYKEKSIIVAYVQWTQQVLEDEWGTMFFKGYGAKQFIDVCVIDRCVGFLEVENLYYIIDKKVDDPDDSHLYISEEE